MSSIGIHVCVAIAQEENIFIYIATSRLTSPETIIPLGGRYIQSARELQCCVICGEHATKTDCNKLELYVCIYSRLDLFCRPIHLICFNGCSTTVVDLIGIIVSGYVCVYLDIYLHIYV